MTNVLVLGKSGKGKSQICELLSGASGLINPHRSIGHTTVMTGYPIPGTDLTIFDTPCFGDSEGRDCMFLTEYFRQEAPLSTGLRTVFYVKSALDRLESSHYRDITVLNDLFEQQLSARLVVLLTFADKESDPSDLEQTVRDHQQLLKLPVYPVFGLGVRAEESRCQLLSLLQEAAKITPLTTSHLQTVSAEQAQLRELELAHNDAPLQKRLTILKAQAAHRQCRSDREVVAIKTMIASRERLVFVKFPPVEYVHR